MANSTQDDLIILDDTVATLDEKDSDTAIENEIKLDEVISTEDNIVLDPSEEKKDIEEIDLSGFGTDETFSEPVETNNQESDSGDSLIIDEEPVVSADENIDIMNFSEEPTRDSITDEIVDNFDLDEETKKFISKLNGRKDQIATLIENDNSSIKNLEDQIKKINEQVSEYKGKIDLLNEEDKKIDSRISLLTGDIKSDFNKTRKKAA